MSKRKWVHVLSDILLFALSATISIMIRFETFRLKPHFMQVSVVIAICAITKPIVLSIFRVYSRHWRYAALSELPWFLVAMSVSTGIAWAIAVAVHMQLDLAFPIVRSIPILDLFLSIMLAGGLRYVPQLLKAYSHTRADGTARRVLLVGAGDAGAMIAREIQSSPSTGLEVVGFIDDEPMKTGIVIHGIPVLGTYKQLSDAIHSLSIDDVILALPMAPGKTIRTVISMCQPTSARIQTIPSLNEIVSNGLRLGQIRDLQMDDLVRGTPDPDAHAAHRTRYLQGQVVLITGAGGTVGSEICRQVLQHRPKQLILLGHGESGIYRMLAELERVHPNVPLHSVIADIRDGSRLDRIFKMYQPQVVFHTAAHSHIPLFEEDEEEAIMNNVLGTLNLLQAAESYSVEYLVVISCYQATTPSDTVIGATKRITELLVQVAAQRCGRHFVSVRLGTLLDRHSNLFSLWQYQIGTGGPVTITHPEMTRSFVPLPEAVTLAIQSGMLGAGGETFVLDVGEPVRIAELARTLVILSGLEVGKDIEIVFTGLRSRENLASESSYAENEVAKATSHGKVFAAIGPEPDPLSFQHAVDDLIAAAQAGQIALTQQILQSIVSQYLQPTAAHGWSALAVGSADLRRVFKEAWLAAESLVRGWSFVPDTTLPEDQIQGDRISTAWSDSDSVVPQEIRHDPELEEIWLDAQFQTTRRRSDFTRLVSLVAQNITRLLDLPSAHGPIIYQERLYGFTLKAESVFAAFPSVSELLLVFVECDQLDATIDILYRYLSDVAQRTEHVILLCTFARGEELERAPRLLREHIGSVYAFDIIPLGLDDCVGMFNAEDPQAAFCSLVLANIDLLTLSPFVVTGAAPDAMFFGREHELREVAEHVESASYVVIGGRRIGKTSVLGHLHRVRLPNAGFRTLYHDCSTTPTYDTFMARNISNWRPEPVSDIAITFGDLFQSPSGDRPLVLLLDEADKLVSFDRTAGWPLFNTLRALTNSGHAQVVLSGERILRSILHDPKSPLFNFANEILLGPLDFRAVGELVTRPMKKLEIELPEQEALVDHIWVFTSGHPNVVQRLCRRLIERLNKQGTRRVTLDDVDAIIADPGFQREDFLSTYWEAATSLEKIISLLMADDEEARTLHAVRQALTERCNLAPKAREVDDALQRLVDLRSILKRTPTGYEFAVEAFPRVVAGTMTLSDMFEILIEEYQEQGE